MLILKVATFIVNEMQLKHEDKEVKYCQLTTNRNHFSFAMFERGIGTTGKLMATCFKGAIQFFSR